MKIKLHKSFEANTAVDETDVTQLKRMLNRLGYYQPLVSTGITAIPDAGVFTALKAFQKDQGLPATGIVKPDDKTIHALNTKISDNLDGYYIWRTVGDDRVRDTHAAHDWETRKWGDGPSPGEESNCRCWAEPATAEQVERKKKQRCYLDVSWKDNVKRKLSIYENDIPHPYIDTAFKITVGIGINIDEREKFINLPWKNDSGLHVTKDEIESAYAELTRQKSNQRNIKEIKGQNQSEIFNVMALNQKEWTSLSLPQEFRDEMLERALNYFYDTILTKKFADFDCFPSTAKMGLMDMIYNLGETRFSRLLWPNLFKAVNQRDWRSVAGQSHRRIPNDATNRNQDTYNQFMQAAELEDKEQHQ